MSSARIISFVESINEAIYQSMQQNPHLITFGLGCTDPKAVFGTTSNLEKEFGSDRVFDTPVSENGMTGVAIGAALCGVPSLMTHQRLDFALYSLDQIINNAAKWHYMFGGASSVNITIRLILGQGWGQGPTHSQNLQGLFAHVPGLKVVIPSNPYNAKGLLISALQDPNPVIFLEHRWLHSSTMEVPCESYSIPLTKMNVQKKGRDLTLVTNSSMVPVALQAIQWFEEFYPQFSLELVDATILAPKNFEIIHHSVEKTRRILVIDTDHDYISFSSEVLAYASENFWNNLIVPPARLGTPNVPTPTSFSLTKDFHPNAFSIFKKISELLELPLNKTFIDEKINSISTPHDIPGAWFKGPF